MLLGVRVSPSGLKTSRPVGAHFRMTACDEIKPRRVQGHERPHLIDHAGPGHSHDGKLRPLTDPTQVVKPNLGVFHPVSSSGQSSTIPTSLSVSGNPPATARVA